MGSRRPRRRFRSLIVVLVILVGLLVVADRLAESFAEGRLATMAADEAAQYDVQAADTSVEVGGFGFLPQVARGEFSQITLTMDQPTISKVSAEDLTVVMKSIQVPRELLTGDTSAPVNVGTADVHLRLSPAALTKVARTSGLDGLSLQIVGGKLQARVTVRGVEARATIQPQAQNGRIRLAVGDLPSTVPSVVRNAINNLLARGIEIPELPFGATLKEITVDGQSVLLTATASDIVLNGA
ncbi:DUF2993 domain-containing protein [Kribbella qitaiheensis]|uniref:LmeA family phospholipid-binding protein n=1 Tax=Kribbella qitaiheensis TaxID=1544730 RepID=UPI0036D30084